MEGHVNSKRKGFVWLDVADDEEGEIDPDASTVAESKQFVAFCGGYTSKTFNFAEDIDDNCTIIEQ